MMKSDSFTDILYSFIEGIKDSVSGRYESAIYHKMGINEILGRTGIKASRDGKKIKASITIIRWQ